MLRELHLNKKETLGFVSKLQMFLLIPDIILYYVLFIFLYLQHKVQSLVEFSEVSAEENTPLVKHYSVMLDHLH